MVNKLTKTPKGQQKPPTELVTRAELARLAGRSRAAVTKACRGVLAGAVRGPRVDLTHDSVRIWLGQAAAIETSRTGSELHELLLRKRRAEVERLELANAEASGRLIPREPVKRHIFGVLDAAFRRLLIDAPKTAARRVYALCRCGESIEVAERAITDINSSHLRHVKETAVRNLRAGKDPRPQ
jgi:hypothetical protein